METLAVINQRLADNYGRFEDGRPNWRVVWSDDELEKRVVTHTKEGFELAYPEVQEVKKYGYISSKYVLERLVPVPSYAETDLVTKTSYEPVWTFEDSKGNPLPPVWEAIFLLIEVVRANLSGRKAPYKAPWGEGNTIEEQEHRAKKIYEELFGNESKITDALSLDTAVGYGPRKRNDWTH